MLSHPAKRKSELAALCWQTSSTTNERKAHWLSRRLRCTIVFRALHKWKEGTLTLKVQWDNEGTTWETLQDLKEDHSRLVASYIISHDRYWRKNGSRDINLIWAKKALWDYDRAIRRITRLYNFYLDENNNIYSVRRAVINKGKQKR